MPNYQKQGSINTQTGDIPVTVSISYLIVSQTQVVITNFTVNDIILKPINTGTTSLLRSVLNIGEEQSLRENEVWVTRGDAHKISRCFVAVKGGNVPLGYFNIGTSTIKITYGEGEFTPTELVAFDGRLPTDDFIKVVYAATCYYDLIKQQLPDSFTSPVIYIAKGKKMAQVLVDAGWNKPVKGDPFFDALTHVAPEVQDGREGRFKAREDDGQFMERSFLGYDDSKVIQTGFTPADLYVHEFGSILGLSPEASDGAGGSIC